MKVLLTVHQFFPEFAAGTEVLTRAVARELRSRGHEVRVLTGHPGRADLRDEERCDEYDFEGIHVHRFHHAYTPMGGQRSMIEVGYDNRLASAYFKRIVDAWIPDVVHFFHLNRLGSGMIEHAAQAGIPRFMTPTDFWTICPTAQLVCSDGSLCAGPSVNSGNCIKHFAQSTQGGLVRFFSQLLPVAAADLLGRLSRDGVLSSYPRRVEVMAIIARLGINVARLNQLSALVVPNKFMREMLVRHGVLPELIIQSSFGVDGGAGLVPPRVRLPQQPLRVGFIGTLAPHKGCEVLIKAFKMLPRGAAGLRIYGNTTDFPDYSAALKRLTGDWQSIEFCGTFDNSLIGHVFADLDVLVVPSLWYENTPLVVHSAQAARCAVVASDFPGLSEVVRDQENGLLFEAGNSAELARQLFRLVDEPELAAQLGRHARPPKSTATYVDELMEIWARA
jgi:glycosyltransferase involved in cell wall biosynthesis